ncbi:uncharacterized protein, partial [Clytia hemisphaerica]
MMINNFKKPELMDSIDEHRNELYKGAWEGDMRHGPGICFYEDGSKFIGQWKDNHRHGYGLFIDHLGEKSGGKWYNDTLILMTRRNNIKLPMVKKKIKRSVLDAIEAAEKASKKTRLAITRGLAARKLAEEAETASTIAAGDAEKAQDFRRKFTLHPLLKESLRNLNHNHNENSDDSSTESLNLKHKSTPNLQVNDSPSGSMRRKRHSFSSLISNQHERIHKKSSSFLTPLSNDSTENIDLDVLHSFQKHPASESALYAAMDTTIGAGAFNPFLSQMVLMQYNDAQTRITNSLTRGGSALTGRLAQENSNMFASTFVPMTARKSDYDNTDGSADSDRSCEDSPRRSSSANEYLSRRSSTASDGLAMAKDSGFWRSVTGMSRSRSGPISPSSKPKRTLLHPSDCARKRRSGVANMSVDSGDSITSEDVKTIEMKGKLLTGDEVNYSYIALNTGIQGKDSVVLYTDHPRPKFRSDFSISEKTLVNSSTGLYRTLVGEVPRVLNPTSKTGIPEIDGRRDSIDSGTADGESLLDSRGYVKNGSTSSKDKLPISRTSSKGVRYSFSPSFEDRDTDVPAEKSPLVDDCKPPPTYDDVFDKSVREKEHTSSIRICHRNPKQVIITSDEKPAESSAPQNEQPSMEIHIESSVASSVDSKTKPSAKKGLAGLLAKTLWRKNSSLSVRSTSTDSGYKQSFSLDDASVSALSPKALRYSPQPPVIDEKTTPHNESSKSTLNTTVVSIENDKHRQLNTCGQQTSKRGSLKRSSLKKRVNGGNLNTDEFDQNRTIEQSPLPGRKIELPTFFDRDGGKVPLNGSTQSVDRQFNKRSTTTSMEDYVILDEQKDHLKKIGDSKKVGCLKFV